MAFWASPNLAQARRSLPRMQPSPPSPGRSPISREMTRGIHFVCGAAGKAEAQVVVPVLRIVPAVRRTAVPGVVVRASAPVRVQRPPIGVRASTQVRKRQLLVPPALVKATSAKCCGAVSRPSHWPDRRSHRLCRIGETCGRRGGRVGRRRTIFQQWLESAFNPEGVV